MGCGDTKSGGGARGRDRSGLHRCWFAACCIYQEPLPKALEHVGVFVCIGRKRREVCCKKKRSPNSSKHCMQCVDGKAGGENAVRRSGGKYRERRNSSLRSQRTFEWMRDMSHPLCKEIANSKPFRHQDDGKSLWLDPIRGATRLFTRLFTDGFQQFWSAGPADLLASNHAVPARARLQLRLRAVH